jgi:hypothetical protein
MWIWANSNGIEVLVSAVIQREPEDVESIPAASSLTVS